MKIHLAFEETDSANTHFTVAVDGQICGKLSMTTGEAAKFTETIKLGSEKAHYEFNISGDVPVSEDWVLWHKRSGIERREMEDRRSGVERRNSKGRRG